MPKLEREQVPERPPIARILSPLQKLTASDAAGGILLLAFTVAALIWANSPFAELYDTIFHTKVTIGYGDAVFSKTLVHLINDGLMAIFFLFVGLEIKREVLVGELASLRHAALPIAGACGGVLVPALIYTAFNWGKAGANGWGIPMATDIAFAVGVLAILGRRVPTGVTVFLMGLAIVDDIAAVLVIAVFYTASLSGTALALAAACLGLLFLMNRLGVRDLSVYMVVGIVLWASVLKSGVHATIAGVLLAMAIPIRIYESSHLLQRGREDLDRMDGAAHSPSDSAVEHEPQQAARRLEESARMLQTPLHRLESALEPWVVLVIMPVFALANAGISFAGETPGVANPVTLGVVFGLLLGKPLGITVAAWLSVKSGVAALPPEVTWSQIHGAGWLGGIGFTMSLFIASLALEDPLLTAAKIGILSASLLAGITGCILLVRASGR